MCIIVDVNVFPSVFSPSNATYAHFNQVEKHIRSGKSKLIWGGTKFTNELSNNFNTLRVISELNRQNLVVKADDISVDALESKIKKAFSDPELDDEHIVALSCVSNARLVCTRDKGLTKYLKRREFYNKGLTLPKIFNDKSAASIVPSGSFKPTCKFCK